MSIVPRLHFCELHCKDIIPKIQKQIFPGKELRGCSPNSYIHFFVSDLYFTLIGLPGRKIGGRNVGIYRSVTDTLGLRPRNSFSGNT